MLGRLVAAWKLKPVARWVYGLPGRQLSEHRSLAEVALCVPNGGVCLLSALRAPGVGTQASFKVGFAVSHRAPIPRRDHPEICVVRMFGAAFKDGIEHLVVDGVDVPFLNAVKKGGRLLQIPQRDRYRRGCATRR
jgi:hypothetical protein